jgi:hypothetical protein
MKFVLGTLVVGDNMAEKLYVSNAFSLNMLSFPNAAVQIVSVALEVAKSILLAAAEGSVESIVGHADTALLFSNALGTVIPFNRVSVNFDGPTALLIGQYIGPRLLEGTTELPAGSRIEWKLVSIIPGTFQDLLKKTQEED